MKFFRVDAQFVSGKKTGALLVQLAYGLLRRHAPRNNRRKHC